MNPHPSEKALAVRLTLFLLRTRSAMACLILFGTALTAHGILESDLEINNTSEAFINKTSPIKTSLELLRREFGSEELYIIVAEGKVFTPQFLKSLAELHKSVVEVGQSESLFSHNTDDEWGDESGGSAFESVYSLINARETKWVEGQLLVGQLKDSWPPRTKMSLFRTKVLSEKSYKGRLVGRSGKLATILIQTTDLESVAKVKIYENLQVLLQTHQKPHFKLHLAGSPVLAARADEVTLEDLKIVSSLSLLLMFVALCRLFRSISAVIGPILVVLLSGIFTVGVLVLFDIQPTLMTNTLPLFISTVALADAIHFQSVFFETHKSGFTVEQSLCQATEITVTPMFFTSLTTMLGLFSFQFASAEAIQDLGLIGGIGVGIAFLFTLVILPLILSLSSQDGAQRTESNTDLIDRMLRFCNHLSGIPIGGEISTNRRRCRRVLLAGLVVGMLSMVAATQLNVWHDPLTWFSKDDPVRVSYGIVDEALGGASFLSLVLECNSESGFKDLKTLKSLEGLENALMKYHDTELNKRVLANSTSILDIVRETRQALNEGRKEFYGLPETQEELNDLFFVFESASSEQLRQVLTLDNKVGHMTFSSIWLPANRYAPLTSFVEEQLSSKSLAHLTIQPTGIVFMFYSTIANLLQDLLRSFGFAFISISIAMIFVLRDIKLALISTIPNLLPITMLLGFMALCDIPLDLSSALLGSLALGICVDDTIHIMHHFNRHYTKTGDVDESIMTTFTHSGRAIVTTSIVLMTGGFLYVFSTLLNIRMFGILIGLTIFFALFADLILTPAVLRAAYSRQRPSS